MNNNWTFDFEFTSDIEKPDDELRTEARTRIEDLRGDHDDIVGAAVAVEELTESATPHLYRARVVLYVRPDNIVAEEKRSEALSSLQGALSAVERQVRERREKLRTRWQQP